MEGDMSKGRKGRPRKAGMLKELSADERRARGLGYLAGGI